MTTTRRIAVVTTSRADYGHLYWLLHDLRAEPAIDLKVIAFGPHLSPEFGRTVDEIGRDGFQVDETIECLLSSDTDIGMAKTLGLATLGLADTLGRLRPDLLVVIADRYEMLAAATVALTLRIPIAHIEGGDLSEGAIDDAVRNALTKLSHLHFTTTEQARRRVVAMGEEPWRVHRVGALSLDHLTRRALPPVSDVATRLDISLGDPFMIVACHPETLERDTAAYADAVFLALAQLPLQIVFCFPNADAGSRSLIDRARRFCAARNGLNGSSSHKSADATQSVEATESGLTGCTRTSNGNAWLVVNLPAADYWSLLSASSLLIGNSSSGVMESASLRKPAINVGSRQQGREHAANVVDVPANSDSILEAVDRVLSPDFRAVLDTVANPYGDGHAAEHIVRILAKTPLDQALLVKRAQPLAPA